MRTNLGVVLIAYGVILVVGLVLPLLAVLLYFAVAVILILPLRTLRRVPSSRTA